MRKFFKRNGTSDETNTANNFVNPDPMRLCKQFLGSIRAVQTPQFCSTHLWSPKQMVEAAEAAAEAAAKKVTKAAAEAAAKAASKAGAKVATKAARR